MSEQEGLKKMGFVEDKRSYVPIKEGEEAVTLKLKELGFIEDYGRRTELCCGAGFVAFFTGADEVELMLLYYSEDHWEVSEVRMRVSGAVFWREELDLSLA